MDFLVNTRGHIIDLLFVRSCSLAPLFILGLANPDSPSNGLTPMLASLAGIAWGFVSHANVRWRLGIWEEIVASPAFHHWHHTREAPLGRNYAATLPVLDRVFGTMHLPDTWPESYGIDYEMPESLVAQFVEPFAPGAARE
jgi:sterol desaturase/sphingolipid hydroxylase (fatty acid hydroxylase superfamily)